MRLQGLQGSENIDGWGKGLTNLDEHTFDARDYRKDNPLSFTNISEKWKEMKAEKVRPHSLQSIKNHLDKAQAYFRDENVKTVDYASLEDFFMSLTVGEKTKYNIKATLHSLFAWLKKRKIVSEIPEFPEIEFELGYRKTVDKDVQGQILDEVWRIADHRVWLGIRFLATYISLRPMELMNVKWENIDLINGYIYIPHPKEKKYKAVPILPEDVVLLSSFPRELPGMFVFGGKVRYGENRFYKTWKRACANLGIGGVDLYGGTRHSSARALRKYFSPEQIKRATMHSSNAAFERYFCMESDDVRSMYRRSADIIPMATGDNELTREKAGG